MKRILLIGLIGHNLGDEAIGVAVNHYLKSSGLQVSVTTLVENRLTKYGIDEYLINRSTVSGVLNIINIIFRSDIVVVGGGSLVQDKLGLSLLRGVLAFLMQIVLISRVLGKPVVSVPIGVDTLATKLGKFYAYVTLSFISKLFVRDELSLINTKIYKRNSTAKLGADPAFLINDAGYSNISNLCCDKYIVISLVKENLDDDNFVQPIIALIESYKKHGIILLAMDDRDEDELSIYSKIVDELGEDRIRIVNSKEYNVFEVTSLIRNADYLVAMRLHSVILGVGYVKSIVLSRTTKTDAVAKQFGLKKIDISKPVEKDILVSELENISDDDLIQQHEERLKYEQLAKDSLEELLSWITGLSEIKK